MLVTHTEWLDRFQDPWRPLVPVVEQGGCWLLTLNDWIDFRTLGDPSYLSWNKDDAGYSH
jgi:hypothetical protein